MQHLSILSILLVLLLMGPGFSLASPGVTYHGRLMRPDGNPLTSTAVHFKIQIRTPLPTNCLLYEEIQTKDLSISAGVFSITVNDGSASALNEEPFTLARAFENRGTFNFAPGKCSGDDEYKPGPTDGRLLYVYFNDGLFSGWEPLLAQQINFVPMALESLSVGGHRPSNFFRVNDDDDVVQDIDPWTIPNYQKLLDIVTYTTTTGSVIDITGNAAGFTGTLAGDVTGTQKATVVGAIQGNPVLAGTPTNGHVLTWNHANQRWEAMAPPSTATPIGAASGDLAGTYPGPVIAPNAVTGDKIAPASVGVAHLAAGSSPGQVMRYSGTAWQIAHLNFHDLINNNGASPWPGAGCGPGQAVVWSAATDTFTCQDILIQSSNIVDGSIDTADIKDLAVTNEKIASVTVNKVANGPGLYLDYRPGNTECATNQVLRWDGTNDRWICANTTSGTLTEVQTGSGLTGGPITSTGTISIATGGVTSSHIANGTIDTVDLKDSSVTTAKIVNVAVNKIANGAGLYLDYRPNGTECAANQVLRWNASSDRWECGSTTSGTVTEVHTGSGLTGGTITGTGTISIAAGGVTSSHIANGTIVAADLNASVANGLWQGNGTNVYRSIGSVGVGVTNPTAKVEVDGQILSLVNNAGSGTSIDWNAGNIQYTTASCGNFTFSNMREGGSYTLIVKGGTAGTCSFSQSSPDALAAGAFRFMPANGPTTSGRQTVFTFLRAGNTVYVSWISGF